MSDPRMMGDPADEQVANGVKGKLTDSMSIFNPTDAQAMKQGGKISPDMPIRDFFANFGIDVDNDPLSKLIEFQKQQISNADPMNKMKNIAGESQQGPAPIGQQENPVGRPPEVQSGLAGLKTRLGG